ncbi:MAG: EAL domain-containing protein [Gammaproteobacteria bacterium]|nr:EAL domain-containing protein [Gammaproteobacteria bacterium]
MEKNPGKSSASSDQERDQLKKEIAQLNSKLSISNSAFLNFMNKSLDGIIILDEKKIIVYANSTAIHLFDCRMTDLLDKPLNLNINLAHLLEHNEIITEFHLPKTGEHDAIASVSVIKTDWSGRPGYLVSFHDITERKKSEETLNYISHHDPLTDLPNRVYFEEQLNKAIDESNEIDQHTALLYLDLDNFKIINDTFGHYMGDQLLKAVSIILQRSIRRGDTVARFGGDEFAIVLRGLRKPEYATSVASAILDKLGDIFNLEGNEIYTNVSIGIAVHPFSGITSAELIKNADTAMYAAKKNGKNQYCFYTAELNEKNEKKLQLNNGLRNVVHNKELFLQYQPIIDINTSTCCGIEALVRWNHPQLGLIPPNEFLPYAEETGMMLSIGQWVIQQALNDYKQFTPNGTLLLAVNLSANELNSAKTAETILMGIQKYAIPTNKVVLELTETSIMRHPEESIEKFKKLSQIGVRIAIDDYGAGYSSLNYLKRLPISLLKIDKSFIDDIGQNSNASNIIIVKSTIELAHSLGLKVIAEGVESKDQFEFLKDHRCDYAQGFYFSKPLNIDALKIFITKMNG